MRTTIDFHGDSADVEPTRTGFTVYRTTPAGHRWAEVTYRSSRDANARAAMINEARALAVVNQ